jgi:hypothetical protein
MGLAAPSESPADQNKGEKDREINLIRMKENVEYKPIKWTQGRLN